MSNSTSLSEEASVSSGNRVQDFGSLNPMFSTVSPQQQTIKRKRNLPGNPDPNAEVIALSPKTLMATNRFVCEICNKGFQRDQNLQLHRRGHNLPWKLRQRSGIEIRKRVYVCPEPSCVHHAPSRALGDLTGIKKHFCRKHGEKKWRCEKCSKRYAVQSDWKAHSKTCGTREYRCDCGTLFSRKDSFITHRAFCDALAEETARLAPPLNPLLQNSNPFSYPPNSNLQQISFPNITQLSSSLSLSWEQNQNQSQETKPSIIPLNPKPSSDNFTISPYFSSQEPNKPILSQFVSDFTNQVQPTNNPHMSATALLQKAAKMGATISPDQVPQMGYQTHLEIDDQIAEMVSALVETRNRAVSQMVTAGISPEMEPESSTPAMQEMLSSRFGPLRETYPPHRLTRDFLGLGDNPNMNMRELLSLTGMDLSYEGNQSLKSAAISNSQFSPAAETWENC